MSQDVRQFRRLGILDIVNVKALAGVIARLVEPVQFPLPVMRRG